MTQVRVAVPRKGRPLEAVLDGLATHAPRDVAAVADEVVSTLRYEKAVAKGDQTPGAPLYDRLATYSDLTDPNRPEYTLLRDERDGLPRRIVFDSLTLPLDGTEVQLVGREEPFRALRKHEFALGFDSADLVLEEVVELRDEPLADLDAVNERIDPLDTDVRVVGGLGDVVHHTLLASPDVLDGDDLDRSFVTDYEGPFCISPRYERLVEATLGTGTLEGIEFVYPDGDVEEGAIAEAGVGAYLTVTGSTARDYGLVVGEQLFPSETVLLKNVPEMSGDARDVARLVAGESSTTSQAVQ